MKKLFIFLIVLFFCSTVTATNYYVSFTNGTDTNNGLGSTTAWKTTAKISASAYNAGDNIWLEADQTWNPGSITVSSSGTSGNPITFGKYNGGNDPIINGNAAYPAISASSKNYITIQDIKVLNGPSSSASGIIKITNGTGTLIRRITTGTNTGNMLYMASCGSYTVDNCDIRYSANNGVHIEDSVYGTITNNLIDLSDNHGIYMLGCNNTHIGTNTITNSGAPVDNCITNPGTHGIDITVNGTYPTSDNFTIIGNTIEQSADSGIAVIGSNSNPARYVANGTITYNILNRNGESDVTWTGNVYNIYNAHNTMTYVGTQTRGGQRKAYWGTAFEPWSNGTSTATSPRQILVEHNTISYAYDNGHGDGKALRLDANARAITYRYNTVKYCQGSAINIGVVSGTCPESERRFHYYNLCINNGINDYTAVTGGDTLNCGTSGTHYHKTSMDILGATTPSGGTFSVNGTASVFNNTFYGGGTKTTPYGLWTADSDWVNATSGNEVYNNIFNGHGTFSVYAVGTGQISFAKEIKNLVFATTTARLNNYSWDSSDIIADPLFVNKVAENLRLQWNSPCIDAGTSTVGVKAWDGSGINEIPKIDYYGNPIYGLPDIGCIEYQPPYSMGTNTIDITGTLRMYADSKWRYLTGTSSGTAVTMDIYPTSGRLSGTYSNWMDIEFETWDTSTKKWKETAAWGTNTTHRIEGLTNGTTYDVYYGSPTTTLIGNYTASNGSVTFNYTAGYSDVWFTMLTGSGAGTSMTYSGNTDDYAMTRASAPDVFDGLVFRAPLNQSAGSSVRDVSGYNANGTITGATWVNVDGRRGLSFDGITNRVNCGDPADGYLDFGTNSSFTVMTWVKGGDNLGSANLGSVMDKGGYNNPGWILNLGTNSAKVAFTQGTATVIYPSFGTASAFIGKFGHMAMVVNRDTDNILTYANGNQTGTLSILTGKGSVASSWGLFFGTSYTGSWPVNVFIDDARIYNRALSAAEVYQAYMATKQ